MTDPCANKTETPVQDQDQGSGSKIGIKDRDQASGSMIGIKYLDQRKLAKTSHFWEDLCKKLRSNGQTTMN